MLKNKYISKKSIYLTGINQFKIEKKLKKIDKKQVLIKVDSCGICSSDLIFLLVLILMVDFQITLLSIRKFYLKFLILNIRVKQN